jgi:hypothetical protein
MWIVTSSDERFWLVGAVHKSRAESRRGQRRASSSPSSTGLLYMVAL